MSDADPPGERAETNELAAQLDRLEADLAAIRRLVTDSPKRVRELEDRLRETQRMLVESTARIEQLTAALQEAGREIVALATRAGVLPPESAGESTDVSAGGDAGPQRTPPDQAMLKLFDARYRRVIVAARREARALGHHYIGTEHMLLGLLVEANDGALGDIWEERGVGFESARFLVSELVGRSDGPTPDQRSFTPRAKTVLELSRSQARERGHTSIGAEHLVLGLLREGNGIGVRVLVELGVDLKLLRQQVSALIPEVEEAEPAVEPEPEPEPESPPAPQGLRPADAHVPVVFADASFAGVEPQTAEAYYRRAERTCREEPDAAMADLGEAIRMDPDYFDAYRLRSRLLAGHGDFAGGLADLERAVELRPEDIDARTDRGLFREFEGDAPGALEDYDEAIRLAPERAAGTFRRRAAWRRRSGDIEGARSDFDEAVRLEPSVADSFGDRGEFRLGQEDFEGALADYDAAIRLDPWVAPWFMRRGATRLHLDNPEAALADLDQALRLDPRLKNARQLRALVRWGRQDRDGTVADLEELCRQDPENTEYAEQLDRYRSERDEARG